MNETYISFYLREGRIYIYIDALRQIGCPDNICFMIEEKGDNLLMKPYPRKDLRSHRVPKKVYDHTKRMYVFSTALCRILSRLQNWDNGHSYRVPGTVIPEKKIVIFPLGRAEIIHE